MHYYGRNFCRIIRIFVGLSWILKKKFLLIKKELLTDDAIIIFETSEDNNFDLDYEGCEVKKKKYGKIVVFKMVKC